MSARPSGPGTASATLIAVLVGWFAVDALAGLITLWEPRPEDFAPLRWARVLARHPIRSGMAISAITRGLIPHSRPTDSVEMELGEPLGKPS